MIEYSLLTAGAGLILSAISGKETEKETEQKETSPSSNTEQNTLPQETEKETEQKETSPSSSDPRDGEMYFGKKMDGGKYDPFYDYGNDDTYNTPYAIQATEMVQEALSRAYRARIVAPFFSKKDYKLDDKYTYLGFPTQKLDIDNWEFPMPALPFVRGGFSVISFVVEVFNPFDFEVPLQKMRIGNMSIGGKRIYPLPNLRNYTTHLDEKDTEGHWWRNLALTKAGLAQYWGNYLLRCEHDMKTKWGLKDDTLNNRSYLSAGVKFDPTDFEIDLVADSAKWSYHLSNCESAMAGGGFNLEQVNKISEAKKLGTMWPTFQQVRGGIPNNWIMNASHDDNLGKLYTRDRASFLNGQLSTYKGVQQFLLDTDSIQSLCEMVGTKYEGKNIVGAPFIPANISGGVAPITSFAKKKMMIPARKSVLLQITMPVAEIGGSTYCGYDYIYRDKGAKDGFHRANMRTSYKYFDYDDELEQMSDMYCVPMLATDGKLNKERYDYQGLTKNELEDLRKLYNLRFNDERAGGFLFLDFNTPQSVAESDFRMACSFYANAEDSVIQNHLSKNKAKINNTKVFDLGCYRGGRPNAGDYEWEKTYWENKDYYESLYDAFEAVYGDGSLWSTMPDFTWDFAY